MYQKTSGIWVLMEKARAIVPCSCPHRRQKIPEISPVTSIFSSFQHNSLLLGFVFYGLHIRISTRMGLILFDNVNINNGDMSG
jgi:hypothetical protein